MENFHTSGSVQLYQCKAYRPWCHQIHHLPLPMRPAHRRRLHGQVYSVPIYEEGNWPAELWHNSKCDDHHLRNPWNRLQLNYRRSQLNPNHGACTGRWSTVPSKRHELDLRCPWIIGHRRSKWEFSKLNCILKDLIQVTILKKTETTTATGVEFKFMPF